MTRGYCRLWGFLSAMGAMGATALGQHAGDVFVGRTSDGQLRVAGFVAEEEYAPLLPVTGILQGWTDNDPGFDRVVTNAPEEDLYTLASGAMIWLQLVEADPAFRVIDASFAIIDNPGEQTFLGNHQLHAHLTWHVNSQNPAFDPNQCVWRATFRLRDAGSTGYADSEPFTLAFSIVPLEPADGDFDEDLDADLEDHSALVDCLHGPETVPAPTIATDCEVDCINAFDFDEDGDVDLRDVAGFQAVFGQE